MSRKITHRMKKQQEKAFVSLLAQFLIIDENNNKRRGRVRELLLKSKEFEQNKVNLELLCPIFDDCVCINDNKYINRPESAYFMYEMVCSRYGDCRAYQESIK